jgi:hypothetical protein
VLQPRIHGHTHPEPAVCSLAGVAYGLLLAATAALGSGFGMTLMDLNTYAVEFFREKSEAARPALHAVLGTGIALAPVLVVVFIGAPVSCLLPFGGGVGFLVLALASLTQPLAAFCAIVTAGQIAAAIASPWVNARWIYPMLPVLILVGFLGIPRVPRHRRGQHGHVP